MPQTTLLNTNSTMDIQEQIRLLRRRRTAHNNMTLLERTLSSEPIPENDLKNFHTKCSAQSSPTSVSASLLQPLPVPPNMQLSSTDTETLELVNQERARRYLKPFQQSMALNQLAAQHATAMCQAETVFHSVASTEELMFMLGSTAVAENVQRGDCVAQMHLETMHDELFSVNQSNLLSPYFSEFGSAVVMGRDDKLYSCQLFQG